MVRYLAGCIDGSVSVASSLIRLVLIAGAVATAWSGSNVPGAAELGEESPVVDPAYVYCTVCGARNSAGSRFCREDGSPIPEIDLNRLTLPLRRRGSQVHRPHRRRRSPDRRRPAPD